MSSATEPLLPHRPRILVTNDDGITAPGLVSLERIANALSDDVWVVAPDSEQSGSSHSLSLHTPLRVRKHGARRYSVLGTPTDCVGFAVKHLLKGQQVDLVLSGVNRGSNIAEDVTYSGTVAAAMEGTALGVPSIALSQAYGFQGDEKVRFETAEMHGPGLVAALVRTGWPQGVLININFPDREPEAVERIEATRQGKRDQSNLIVEERRDLRNHSYYWLGMSRKLSDPPEGTDLRAIYAGRISVTPLHLNLTELGSLPDLDTVVGGMRLGNSRGI